MRFPRAIIQFGIVATVVSPHAVKAQPSAAQASADSFAQNLMVRFPCPPSVPRGWVAGDSTNGGGVRCSLVLAAARGLMAATTSATRPVNPWLARCVTLDEQLPLPKIGILWRVVFVGDSLKSSSVLVDRNGRALSLELEYVRKSQHEGLCKPAV
jgi:hypothetical protein